MKEKSLEPKLFAQILKDFDDILFISLQYGDPTPEIKLWKDLGIEVLHDPEVNALSDMDKWLSQVSICDAVISVANTTIHGAGGLDIPTKCLLRFSVIGVGSRIQSRHQLLVSFGFNSPPAKNGDWSSAIDETRAWINSGADGRGHKC